ncbi:hypothetical protein JMJ77_0011595 [Colletotrichum scovillei]|uniref:Uncharacterized protein n=1 Tax=Colletotrichum scovillei TaxID=1209932 RepID=A0A9P7QY75_9PEZI|nr:hypothetical protein JMJ77_0011595 [Colletotrichum scovillei]KAG7045877.1 hypothetical protein JMJ78_0010948 [Colletotrichum scovillei]KAG7063222.1 hypothetical protein JMJ76_0005690 [Colletotrichum scovillei]
MNFILVFLYGHGVLKTHHALNPNLSQMQIREWENTSSETQTSEVANAST